MGYLQSTDQSSLHEAHNLGPAQKSERSANLAAISRAQSRSDVREGSQADRVTLSPAADALAQSAQVAGPASLERLDVLRETIKANMMPIFPQAIAKAILRDENADPSSLVDEADTSFAQSE